MSIIEFISIIGTLASVFGLGYIFGAAHEKSNRPKSDKH